jgi:hypothetical protein
MGSAFGEILPAGLRMTGIYGDGHFFLSFTEDTLWITCNHVSTQASYAVAMNNGQVVLTTTPGPEGAKLGNKTLRLELTPEGNIVGSGNVQITGMVPAPGQHPVANQTRRRYIPEEEARNPPPWENPQRDAGGNPYVDEPTSTGGRTVSKTSACQMFTARPLGSVGPTHATQSLNPLFGSMTAGAPWGQRSARTKPGQVPVFASTENMTDKVALVWSSMRIRLSLLPPNLLSEQLCDTKYERWGNRQY